MQTDTLQTVQGLHPALGHAVSVSTTKKWRVCVRMPRPLHAARDSNISSIGLLEVTCVRTSFDVAARWKMSAAERLAQSEQRSPCWDKRLLIVAIAPVIGMVGACAMCYCCCRKEGSGGIQGKLNALGKRLPSVVPSVCVSDDCL